MSFGSDNDFPPLADFALNQILGYQDVNDIKSMPNRLRDAFQRQHAWDNNTVGDIPWNIAWPNWDLGDHVGNIGVPLHTTFFGDGSNLTAVPGSAVSGMKGATLVASGTVTINLLGTLITLETLGFGVNRFYWASVCLSSWGGVFETAYWDVIVSHVAPSLIAQTYQLSLSRSGGIGAVNVTYKVYRIDET